MTLDYQSIEAAVATERNAGGFAALMQTFAQLGVQRYDYLVADGIYRYYDADGSVDLTLNGTPQAVAVSGNPAAIKLAVTRAQHGEFDFTEFTRLAGLAGVTYWESNLTTKMVTYYAFAHTVLLAEPIPGL